MRKRLLISTAVGFVFATAASAQSPSSTTTAPATSQNQPPATSAPTNQKAPDLTTQAPSSTNTAPGASTGAPQAQTKPPASSTGSSQPAQAQTNNPAPAANQAQQAPASGSATTAQQPTQSPPSPNTAQQPAQPSTNSAQSSSSTNVNASVNINDQQRTRVTQSISRLNVQPLTNVNFSLTVGTAVPRDVRLQTLPADVVEVLPQYRGYSFFVVRDEIVIVEPSTYKIVTMLPRSGGSTAAAPAPSRSKASFTDKDRDVVRKHVKARTTERQTTGSAAKVVIRRGERLPDSVEFEEFPETVYREAPTLREYRYIHRENRTYLVDPTERTVIEEFD